VAQFYAAPYPTFQPAMRNILSITNSLAMVVTTTYDGLTPADHNYLTGLIVQLYIPNGFGMMQANGLGGPITVISSTQFTLPIDTTYFDPYNTPSFRPGSYGTPAQVIPVGEVSSMLTMATQNVLPYP